MKQILSILLLSLAISLANAQEISISSSHKELEKAFEWAKDKAMSFVVTGKTGPVNVHRKDQKDVVEAAYIPSYWAGYPSRTAFYSRDFCHQAAGAHLLGLRLENYTMMKAFAASADAGKKWYPLWAINFDGSPYLLDYKNDDDFVREVPAAFELVEKACRLYSWTGDCRYIDDEILWQYYTRIVTDFISLHDQQFPNGVAEGTGEGNIFKGTATFNEQRDVPMIEAGDGIACQYQAFLSYARMAEWKGDEKTAQRFVRKAADLKTYFNTDWGIRQTDTYNRGYTPDRKPIGGWGKENSWFMPMKEITDENSARTCKYLDFINERLESKDDIPENIEALSYVPEVFFQYHRNEEGWRWMKHIIHTIDHVHAQSTLTGSNGNYPEVSYVLISNTVENLAGVTPDAANSKLQTLSHLPGEIGFLKIENLPFENKSLTISHTGTQSTSLEYNTGTGKLIWEAGFPGEYEFIHVDGSPKKCMQRKDHGKTCSFLLVEMNVGDKKTVTVAP